MADETQVHAEPSTINLDQVKDVYIDPETLPDTNALKVERQEVEDPREGIRRVLWATLTRLRERAPAPVRPTSQERARALLAAEQRPREYPRYGDLPADRAEAAYWRPVLANARDRNPQGRAETFAAVQRYEMETAALDGRPARLLTRESWGALSEHARAGGVL